jgi:hypothetical protein
MELRSHSRNAESRDPPSLLDAYHTQDNVLSHAWFAWQLGCTRQQYTVEYARCAQRF